MSCHANDYENASTLDHVAARLPTTCESCHSTSGWGGALFDHSATRFPLTGAHTASSCETCHVGGEFTGLSTECISCHATNFAGTTSPDHVAAGFPSDCELCHNTSGWPGATFDHGGTRFPLTGSHVSVGCASCHIGNQYVGTPTDCYSCHSSEYESVASPNHLAAGFPTSCESCHSTGAWSGAVFSHRFPIYSGAHREPWDSCSDCHTNPSNFNVFTCLSCHDHRQSEMDDDHSEVGGYVYESLSCYSCHPNGTH